MDPAGEINPMEVLREDLQAESMEVQLEAMRNLDIVAINLGPEQTRTKLIPEIDNFCFKTLGAKEEVLRETALQLNSSILPYLGGAQHCDIIVSMLLKLARVEEFVIRTAAVDSMVDIMSVVYKELPHDVTDKKIIPIISTLADGDWWTSRASAANFAARAYGFISSSQNKSLVEGLVVKLAKDDMPIVREKVWGDLPKVFHVMVNSKEFNPRAFVLFAGPLLKSMSKEAEERMRHEIINSVKVLIGAPESGSKAITDMAKEFLSAATKDNNWKVRKCFVENLLNLVDVSPEKFIEEIILPGFVDRLGDAEPTVRVEAIKQLPKFLAHPKVDTAACNKAIKFDGIRTLIKDQSHEVREAVSASLLPVMAFRTPTPELSTEVIEALKQFHIDERGEVRVNFCKSVSAARKFLGDEKFVEHVVPLVLKLQDDQKWRVRAGVYDNICTIVQLHKEGKLSKVTKDITTILEKPFRDPVSAVRESAIAKIPVMMDLMGEQWVFDTIFKPMCRDLYHNKSKFLLRSVPIRAGATIAIHINAPIDTKNSLMKKAAEMVIQGCQDKISNCRLMSAQALLDWIETHQPMTWKDHINETLMPLVDDPDNDVKYLCKECLNAWKE